VDSAGEVTVLFLNQQFKNETISDENIDKIIKLEGNLEKKRSRFPGWGQKNRVFHRNSSWNFDKTRKNQKNEKISREIF
jgi:hypothetical protein